MMHRVVWCGLLGFAILVPSRTFAADASSPCGVPDFKVAHEFVLAGEGVVPLSVSRRDLTVAKLVCLSRALVATHPEWINIDVYVFDSEFAAAAYNPGWDMSTPGPFRDSRGRIYSWWDICTMLRATLSVRREQTSGASLTIQPLGLEFWSFDAAERIARGAAEGPASGVWNTAQDFRSTIQIADRTHECRVALFGRCLLIATPLRYPAEALSSGASAHVTLTGELAKDGRVKDIRLETAPALSGGAESAFVREATRHLDSLRFEAAPRTQRLRLTYAFEVTASVPYPHLLQVELGFPERISVRASEQRARPH